MLAQTFQQIDSNNNDNIDFNEFSNGIRDQSWDDVSDEEIQELFHIFDRDGNGFVDYPEFLSVMRGKLSGMRLQYVEQAFQSLDRQSLNQVNVSDMMQCYNAKGHPAVQDGRHTEEEALEEFQATFEAHHKDEAREWCTLEEFADYYTDVSALIESDAYFVQLMAGTWSLNRRAPSGLQ